MTTTDGKEVSGLPACPPSGGAEERPGEATPVRVRFIDALRQAQKQIPEKEFPDVEDWTVLQSMHRVMAEVYMLSEDVEIQIDGEKIPAGQLQEVYRQLEVGHVKRAVKEFRACADRVSSVKRYLRSMLYNAIFELDAKEQKIADDFWRKRWP